MNNHPAVVFRADASSLIGQGHIVRCLALAGGLAARGRVVEFACRQAPGDGFEAVRRAGFPLHPLPAGATAVSELDAMRGVLGSRRPLLVTDSYELLAPYHAALKASAGLLAAIDDNAHGRYGCAVVINPNLHAEAAMYEGRVPEGARLLLGPRYAMLRPEFRPPESPRPVPAKARRLLVTLGGADAPNATLGVLRALALLGDRELEADVVIGSSNPNEASLRAFLAEGRIKATLSRDVADMARRMREADLAISASGGTVWELAALGTPAALLVTADIQDALSRRLEAAGAAVRLGVFREAPEAELASKVGALVRSAGRRGALARAAQALVDGRGVERLCDELLGGES